MAGTLAPPGPMAMQLAPDQQQWAEVLADGDDEEDAAPPTRAGIGQVRHITSEVDHDLADDAVFRVSGKDKSWFLQKGAISFERPDPSRFRLEVQFLGGPESRFGDAYAELSRAEQHATVNWLLMVGVARADYELTGYKDCKTSGFYFLLHLNYRRTHWRVIGSPHNSELEDASGETYTCNPQEGGQFELPAEEGQLLGVEYADRELWLLSGGQRVLRGCWVSDGEDEHTSGQQSSEEASSIGKLPIAEYYPAILTSNCPTALRAVVA